MINIVLLFHLAMKRYSAVSGLTQLILPAGHVSSELESESQLEKTKLVGTMVCLATHCLFVFLPTIVVCCHCDAGVAQAGLFGEDNLRHGGHVDDVSAPLSEHQALCPRGEAGSFDGQHGSSYVTLDTQTTRHLHQNLLQITEHLRKLAVYETLLTSRKVIGNSRPSMVLPLAGVANIL